uniref:Serine aminopeptidase S33 domain-containing protein n=1 Tax=Strombidium inclinatum TaxID=197538 RepID=A0A7S3IQX3_9SPIT|mmetsp:Transcript_34713/g.53272  ORF Transcript_34713/g.53272 Transcript_34713/m.53272 type:complete len:368 (+) Transcript_34713:334-1437(+)
MEDGGSMSIDWLGWPQEKDPAAHYKVVLIWAGIGGGSQCDYVKHIAETLCVENKKGQGAKFICGVIHPRGCGMTEHTSPNPYDFTRVSDWQTSMDYIEAKAKDDPRILKDFSMYGVGISLGANQLVKYAGQCADLCKLKGVLIFNSPWDIYLAINLIRGTIFERFMIGSVQEGFMVRKPSGTMGKKQLLSDDGEIKFGLSQNEKENFAQMRDKFGLNFNQMLTASSWREFDEQMTSKCMTKSPVPGAEHKVPANLDDEPPRKSSVAEYYFESSAFNFIGQVKVPTLIVHAKDDPIVSRMCLPLESSVSNPNVLVAMTSRGAHVQYFRGKPWGDCATWREWVRGRLLPNDRWNSHVVRDYINYLDNNS